MKFLKKMEIFFYGKANNALIEVLTYFLKVKKSREKVIEVNEN